MVDYSKMSTSEIRQRRERNASDLSTAKRFIKIVKGEDMVMKAELHKRDSKK